MRRAVSHHHGRRLTGLTFGKRGGPAYARIYDKTREADPDALIRERWAEALGRPLPTDTRVWRVEFEVRPEFLRSLAAGDEHITTDPRSVLAQHLDAIWEHLTSSWLVLRDPRSATRLSRCRPQGWWRQLAATPALCAAAAGEGTLHRKRRSSGRPEPLLRQLAGTLAAFGARRDDHSLDGCLSAFCDYMRSGDGDARFAEAVERAALRLPLGARTQADARSRTEHEADDAATWWLDAPAAA